MGKVTCTKCNAKTPDDAIFLHNGGKYCPECTLEHVRAKHADWYKTPT